MGSGLPGDDRLRNLSNGVKGPSASTVLATMPAIAYTGAMLLSGHEGPGTRSIGKDEKLIGSRKSKKPVLYCQFTRSYFLHSKLNVIAVCRCSLFSSLN